MVINLGFLEGMEDLVRDDGIIEVEERVQIKAGEATAISIRIAGAGKRAASIASAGEGDGGEERVGAFGNGELSLSLDAGKAVLEGAPAIGLPGIVGAGIGEISPEEVQLIKVPGELFLEAGIQEGGGLLHIVKQDGERIKLLVKAVTGGVRAEALGAAKNGLHDSVVDVAEEGDLQGNPKGRGKLVGAITINAEQVGKGAILGLEGEGKKEHEEDAQEPHGCWWGRVGNPFQSKKRTFFFLGSEGKGEEKKKKPCFFP
jgi:hypothetical protein